MDGTEQIVSDYPDARIRFERNDLNLGLIATLNRGIENARGVYVARMDCDDICLPRRLEQQVAMLDADPSLAAVGTPVIMIDCSGSETGVWEDDRRTPDWPRIRRRLTRANCLAHPGMMIRHEVLAIYRYEPSQHGAEDYDLWLRLAIDNRPITKTAEPLLLYRRNPLSITAIVQRCNPDLHNAATKLRLLWRCLKTCSLSRYLLAVAVGVLPDLAYGLAKGGLRYVKQLLIMVGKLIGRLLPLCNRSGLFFFFPFYHTGGAERVHSQIATCFKEQQPWIFFAKRSGDDRFYGQFSQAGRCFDIGWLLKYSYPVSAGILAGLIGKHPDARVFGCNSLFYYLLLPHLPEHVRATDLLHALGGGAEQFSLPVLERLQQRVTISRGVQDELVVWYRSQGVDSRLDQRITVIPNQVEIPQTADKPAADGVLRLLYVGRGGDEKRVHLIGRAARICVELGLAVEVALVGDLDNAIAAEDRACCCLTGLVSDGDQLDRLYQHADLLLITSSREGFPLTVMEGMAHGCVPVCTAVGGIPEHIAHRENGWLLPADDDEAVVNALVQAVQLLSVDRSLLQQLSAAARQYAETRFSGERFCEQYRDVIKGV